MKTPHIITLYKQVKRSSDSRNGAGLNNPFKTLNHKAKRAIRDKAIQRAKTRIVLLQKKPEDFEPDELEVIVQEEESKIYSAIKEKGLLAVLAVLGLNIFG